MPTEVYEDSIDLEIGLIEAENPRADGGEEFKRAYPYPLLRPVLDRALARTFPTVVIENPYLRATFVPALGGRLLRLFDKVLAVDLLPVSDRLMPECEGPRSATLRAGIQVLIGLEERLTGLAETPHFLDPPSDDGPIGVWFFGLERDVSFHAHWTMPPDRAELLVSLRSFNRSFRQVAHNGGLLLFLGSGELRGEDDGFVWSLGLGIWPAETALDSAGWQDGMLRVSRSWPRRGARLGPREVDSWAASITRVVPNAVAATREASLALDSDQLAIRTARQVSGKVVLRTSSGEVFETPLDLGPGMPEVISLKELPAAPTDVALRTAHGEILIQTDLHPGEPIGRDWERRLPRDAEALFDENALLDGTDLRDFSQEALMRAVSVPALRAAAYVVQAMRLIAEGEFQPAAERLEAALLFNAEDPLAWWLRAIALRKAGVTADESPDLLNAHFLAPLEPALRSESFLSQPIQAGRGPAAIIRPLEDQPEAFLEVACLLLDAGLTEEAVRWIDESLRISQLPLLHYLLAYAHLEWSALKAEAAHHVAEASKLPEGPPYPWRRLERTAIMKLTKAFPDDPRLENLAKLVDRF